MKVFSKSTFKIAALAVLGLSTVTGTGMSAQAAPGGNGNSNGNSNSNGYGNANGGQGAGRGWRKGGRGGMNLRAMAQKLNLTAAQQSQIQAIFEGSRVQSRQIRSEASLTEAQRKERLKAVHKASRDAVMNVLTPAQQAQLQQMMAQKRAGKGGNGIGRNMAQELNLTPAQKAQLKEIRQDARADMMAVRNDTSLTWEQKRARLQAIRAQMREAINQILTPEQQAQMQQLRQERRANRRNGNGNNGNGNNVARTQRNRGLNG